MLDKKQMNAIGALGRAFANCEKAGVCFCGMDDNLLAYDKEKFKLSLLEGKSSYEAQEDQDQGETVNDHGTYADSGGW